MLPPLKLMSFIPALILIELIDCTSLAAPPPPPEEIQKALVSFFNLLKKNRIDEAYDVVLINTKVKGREDEVQRLKKQTREAIDTYGPILGFEIVEQRRVGMS